jgi:prophage antirepressor-like protein
MKMSAAPPAMSASSALSLQTFHKDFGEHQAQLTALIVDGEPWFKGGVAAAALGYKNLRQAVRLHVEEEDRSTLENLGGLSTSPLTNPNEGACAYISESGLYSLIMGSKLPYAKAFKRWVLKEVLPTVRRTGSYSAQASLEEEVDDASTMAEALPSLPTDAQQWEGRRARLDALASAHALALAAGVSMTDAHSRAIRSAVNDTFLPADPQRIDAAEFLCRKGHGPAEVRRLAPELGKALKTAWVHQHGDDEAPFDTGVAHYRVREDALFLEEVYGRFRTRPGFARACGEHEEARQGMAQEVAAALQDARGFAPGRRSRARNSSSATVPGVYN